eukprot:TRINITY_DN21963_c0_g1_i1.p2 TRINITY_DN21963_c0_g1~~TRINITY_DN21963_c0_g1_i1.p2  ORF type:complete len:121 (-),score=19.99 TRINITY_DN21963_c0_g1_i1:27-389(-)
MGAALRKEGDSRTLFNLVKNPAGRARYPTLRKLMLIGLCLPLVSVECERVFSRLKLLKTALRNCLSDKSLGAILHMCTCNQADLTVDQVTRVITKFKDMQNRKADLSDIVAFKESLEADN